MTQGNDHHAGPSGAAPGPRVGTPAAGGAPVGRRADAVDADAASHESLPSSERDVSDSPSARPAPPRRLLDEVRDSLRLRHFSPRTQKTYVAWVKRFVIASGRRHPRELGVGDVRRFLTGLAVRGKVSASTQNQARAALTYLYREVLRQPLGQVDGVEIAKRPLRLPVVMTRDEVRLVIQHLDGMPRLVALLLYGCGLRLMEALQLRVKDLDFASE